MEQTEATESSTQSTKEVYTRKKRREQALKKAETKEPQPWHNQPHIEIEKNPEDSLHEVQQKRTVTFDEEKDICVQKLLTNTDDRSRAGKVDTHIIPLLDAINSRRDYF